MAKFKRDQDDYSRGTVYDWGRTRYVKERSGRSVSFSFPSTDDETDGDQQRSDVCSPTQENAVHNPTDFLEYHSDSKVHQKRKTRRGKRGSATKIYLQPEVINISHLNLSDDCKSVLSKGLSFAPTHSDNRFQTKII